MRRLATAALLAATAHGVARGQESLDFVGADRETTAQLTRIMESVKAANLPTEPVVAKARLAMAFHAPPARLVAALQAVATRLEDARVALGEASPTVDIVAGGDALSLQGVTKGMLHLIRLEQPNRSIAVPIGVLMQLVASGVAPREAAEIVRRLVRANATNTQLVALGNDVSGDVLAGAGAATALQIRLEALKPVLAYNAGVPVNAGDALLSAPGTSGTTPKNPRGRP